MLDEHSNRIHPVDYSYTNAVIDFRKSWDSAYWGPCIQECNFAGLDFSNYDINDFNFIVDSDLSDTGIKISKLEEDRLKSDFINNNFSNLDMSHLTFSAFVLSNIAWRCTNTGLNIEFSLDDFFYKFDELGRSCYLDQLEEFREQLSEGYYDGCYLNGKRINTDATKREMASKYEQFKQDIFASVASDINSSIEQASKKK